MGERQSDSSYDGKIEEADVAIKADGKTLNQLSSSGRAAQQNRGGKDMLDLQRATEDLKNKEQSGGKGSKSGEQGQSQQK